MAKDWTMSQWAGVLALGAMGLSGPASATLFDRGNGLIYDNVLDITWMQDANLAASETFGISGIDADGGMGWNKAQEWIAGMNGANYKGYNNWRMWEMTDPNALPSTSGTSGYNVNPDTSELASLWYGTLGNTSDLSTMPASGLTNTGPFLNMAVAGGNNWSGTEYSSNPDSWAWTFVVASGHQGVNLKSATYQVWAVRDGDVSAVPLPAAVWLFGSGLAGLFAAPAWRRWRPA